MAAEDSILLRHALEITFFDLPSAASIRLDFAPEAEAEILISTAVPAIRLGASYGGDMSVQSICLTPRRLQFQVDGAPSTLPLIVNFRCAGAFIHGWLQVPDGVQTCIASAAERIRFVGPGYWAVPLIQAARAETPVGKPAPTPTPTGPAVAKPATARSSRPASIAKPASKPAPAPAATTPTPPVAPET